LREWAIEQDKSAMAADGQWAALSHAETATFFRACADEIEALRAALSATKVAP